MAHMPKILVFLVLAATFMAAPVYAAAPPAGFTRVLELTGSDGAVLSFDTADGAAKSASVGINNGRATVIVTFPAAQAWHTFAAVWAKARTTPPPPAGTAAVGGLADANHALWTGVMKDGTIAFAITSDPHGLPTPDATWFHLKQSDADTLDKAISKVTDYFGK